MDIVGEALEGRDVETVDGVFEFIVLALDEEFIDDGGEGAQCFSAPCRRCDEDVLAFVYQRHRLLLWRREESAVDIDVLAELLDPPLTERRLEEFEDVKVVCALRRFRRAGYGFAGVCRRLRNSITLVFYRVSLGVSPFLFRVFVAPHAPGTISERFYVRADDSGCEKLLVGVPQQDTSRYVGGTRCSQRRVSRGDDAGS